MIHRGIGSARITYPTGVKVSPVDPMTSAALPRELRLVPGVVSRPIRLGQSTWPAGGLPVSIPCSWNPSLACTVYFGEAEYAAYIAGGGIVLSSPPIPTATTSVTAPAPAPAPIPVAAPAPPPPAPPPPTTAEEYMQSYLARAGGDLLQAVAMAKTDRQQDPQNIALRNAEHALFSQYVMSTLGPVVGAGVVAASVPAYSAAKALGRPFGFFRGATAPSWQEMRYGLAPLMSGRRLHGVGYYPNLGQDAGAAPSYLPASVPTWVWWVAGYGALALLLGGLFYGAPKRRQPVVRTVTRTTY